MTLCYHMAQVSSIARNSDLFVPAGSARHQFDPAFGKIPTFGQQGNQRRVGLAVLWRRRHRNPEGSRAVHIKRDVADRRPSSVRQSLSARQDGAVQIAQHHLDENQAQNQHDWRNVDPAKIGQEAPEGPQGRLGDAIEEI